MTSVPDDRVYTKDHEWALRDDATVKVGITDYAQDALGDVVFVELPSVGETFAAGDTLGEVESTKSVSEIYAPVSGRVVEVNRELEESPNRLNDDPYGEGWMCRLEASDPGELDALLSPDAYRAMITEEPATEPNVD